MKNITLAWCLAMVLAFGAPAQAGLVITFAQVGSDVVATSSPGGSLNLSALSGPDPRDHLGAVSNVYPGWPELSIGPKP